MDVNIVNSFIDALLNTLETSASTRADRGKPFVMSNTVAPGPVTGILTVSGDTDVVVSITFSKPGILAIVTRLFGETMEELNDEIKDAVGEISNMVSGQATNTLAQAGAKYKISLDKVILGERHTLPHKKVMKPVALPFRTEDGEFTLAFSVDKA